jgi:hypothetical protein
MQNELLPQPEQARREPVDPPSGAWWTVGRRGQRATVGLPGSGLYWTERVPPAPPPHGGHRLAFVVVVIAVVGLPVWGLIYCWHQTGEMGNIFDEWRPGDLLIEALRVIGLVALAGGVLLAFRGSGRHA